MKKILFCLAFAAVIPVPHAFASNVDFSIGINVGSRPQVVAPVAYPPAYYEPPVAYQEPPVVIEEPPQFIEPPELGFRVAVGIPHDMFLVGNRYYLCRQNVWYAAPHYRGPWAVTRYNALPWKLRRHPYERVLYYRDAGYRHYRHDRAPYWARHHPQPPREWRGPRCEDRESWKRARHEDRERSRYVRYYGGD